MNTPSVPHAASMDGDYAYTRTVLPNLEVA